MGSIKDIGEFGFIDYLKKRNRIFYHDPERGIGDDCAVFEKDKRKVFLATTEIFVEDVHFIKDKISPYELGIKVMNASLSDIAAMGGDPLYAFISLAADGDVEFSYLKDLYRGIKASCRRYKVDLIGGDTSSSPDRLVLNVTVIGEAEKGKVVYRRGAKPGDAIYVTGFLGESSAGLRIIKEGIKVDERIAKRLLKAHKRPIPRLEIGKIASRYADAMIDISDGLVSDLNHICKLSNVGAVIFKEKLPVSSFLKKLKSVLPIYELVLYGGEDYELIVVVPQKKTEEFEIECKMKGYRIYRIGEITRERGIRMREGDRESSLEIKGFRHF